MGNIALQRLRSISPPVTIYQLLRLQIIINIFFNIKAIFSLNPLLTLLDPGSIPAILLIPFVFNIYLILDSRYLLHHDHASVVETALIIRYVIPLNHRHLPLAPPHSRALPLSLARAEWLRETRALHLHHLVREEVGGGGVGERGVVVAEGDGYLAECRIQTRLALTQGVLLLLSYGGFVKVSAAAQDVPGDVSWSLGGLVV